MQHRLSQRAEHIQLAQSRRVEPSRVEWSRHGLALHSRPYLAAVGRRCLQVLVLIEAETQTRQEARPAPDYEAGNLAGPALKLGINNNKQQRQPWQLFGGPGLQPAAQRSANATRREAR